jgi:hypothetical protein
MAEGISTAKQRLQDFTTEVSAVSPLGYIEYPHILILILSLCHSTRTHSSHLYYEQILGKNNIQGKITLGILKREVSVDVVVCNRYSMA